MLNPEGSPRPDFWNKPILWVVLSALLVWLIVYVVM